VQMPLAAQALASLVCNNHPIILMGQERWADSHSLLDCHSSALLVEAMQQIADEVVWRGQHGGSVHEAVSLMHLYACSLVL